MVFDRKAYMRAYQEANREEFAERKKAYRQTPKGKKSTIILLWKQRGLIHDDYDALYDSYLQRTQCDVCKFEYKDSYDRCMDHDHETHLFRQFLCRSCNTMDSWKLKLQNAS